MLQLLLVILYSKLSITGLGQMINFNWVFKIWLTSFLITSGAWVAFGSNVKAQSAGTITINNSSIVQNGTIPNDSTNRGNIFNNPINSVSNGGNIIVTADNIILVKKTIPEPSLVGGAFAVAVTAAVSRLKRKRK